MDSAYTIISVLIVAAIGIFAFLWNKKQYSKLPGYRGNTDNAGIQQYKTNLPEFAAMLGLTYEDTAIAGDKKTLYSMGYKISGIYKGYSINMQMSSHSRESDHTPLGYTYSYEYSHYQVLSIGVRNSGGKFFSVVPMNKNIVPAPTGYPEFDSNLTFSGSINLPPEIFQYFGSLKWMNIKLEGSALVFNDTFYEDMNALRGGMYMMTAVHPIWKTSPQNTLTDLNSAKYFIDMLIFLIEKTGLNK